jgi:predicted dehydrogenase
MTPSTTGMWRPVGDREVRVGLAGLGSMGRNHLRVISSRPNTRLVAVADPVADALDAAVASSGAQGFSEPLAMIAEADVDAVVIAAPTTAHVSLALAAIERNIAVLVEKPLAATVEDGLRIVEAGRARRVPVQVGHVERFNPAVSNRSAPRGRWLSSVCDHDRRAGRSDRIRDVDVTVDLATHDAGSLC